MQPYLPVISSVALAVFLGIVLAELFCGAFIRRHRRASAAATSAPLHSSPRTATPSDPTDEDAEARRKHNCRMMLEVVNTLPSPRPTPAARQPESTLPPKSSATRRSPEIPAMPLPPQSRGDSPFPFSASVPATAAPSHRTPSPVPARPPRAAMRPSPHSNLPASPTILPDPCQQAAAAISFRFSGVVSISSGVPCVESTTTDP